MKLYVDANIYLAFIRSSKESLPSLEKLTNLITEKRITLVFPTITQDEVYRNIHKVAEVYSRELSLHLPKEPEMAVSLRSSAAGKEINELHKKYSRRIKHLIKEYLESVEKTVKNHFDFYSKNALIPDEDQTIFAKAYRRYLVGNPPGKKENPIGDALAWEQLLSSSFDEDLVIVSSDGDWSTVDNEKKTILNPFLNREWKSKSKKEITLYTTLGEFINSLSESEVVTKKEIENEKASNIYVSVMNLLASQATLPQMNMSNMGTLPTNFNLNNLVIPNIPEISGTISYPLESIKSFATIYANALKPIQDISLFHIPDTHIIPSDGETKK